MKKFIIFLAVFLFADVSDTILKLQDMKNMKKKFLKIDYNIFKEEKKPVIKKVLKINKIKKAKKINLHIFAIFNNKININGNWYKKGDIVYDYKIIKVLNNGVVLKKHSKITILKIKESILKVSK